MSRRRGNADPLLTALELGLAATLSLAPLPFGSVRDPARMTLEIAGLILLAIWILRRSTVGCVVPPRPAFVAAAALIVLCAVQVLPLGHDVARVASPNAAGLRDAARPPPEVRAEEHRILGVDPSTLDATATLSLSPDSTLRAMRTGAALFAVWLIAFTVAAERSPRRIGMVVLAAAAFQSVYGILVVASGSDRIWNVPKQHFVDCATGTFVNRNHFAHYVAIGCTIGTAWLFEAMRRRLDDRNGASWKAWLRNDAAEVWLLGGMLLICLAGLFVSFSRSGTAVGVLGVLVVFGLAPGFGRRTRIATAVVLVVVAIVPLASIGPDRLIERYADTLDHLSAPMSRPRVWLDTVEMARAFPVAGSGFGTFAEVYPAFRSPAVRHFFDHAHNDLIQIVAEGGIAALVLIVVVLSAHGIAARRALVGSGCMFAKGLAVALFVVVALALVDFPFHIPATAVLDVAVGGALLGTVWPSRS